MLISSGDSGTGTGSTGWGDSGSSDEVSCFRSEMRRQKVIKMENIKYFLCLNALLRSMNICIGIDIVLLKLFIVVYVCVCYSTKLQPIVTQTKEGRDQIFTINKYFYFLVFMISYRK